ncbi:MAG: pyridoxal-phosphate dependent enzyme [Sediminibacterium sp.]|nr:pyridoxal-phosphate dependent enzyme [Sediminibacterium sp.]MBX9781138.1 pyridoxal-phosphate dependent enzyme [Chitinophagaceae bacterium]
MVDVKAAVIEEITAFSLPVGMLSILRLDKIHPIISGNKWFKLKGYMEEAKSKKVEAIASFGGAYSNHIVALAYAGKQAGIATVGFIRGEDGDSESLKQAREFGMKLYFVSRDDYRDKEKIKQNFQDPHWLWVAEGGYGVGGAEGAADILRLPGCEQFTHIVCACGTGTMMAGLINSSLPHQQIMGISVLKNHTGLDTAIKKLLIKPQQNNWETKHEFHFGGYAKHPQKLLAFINTFWQQTSIPTDIVYTSKLCYATMQLIAENYFNATSKILIIHSGGLQGNHSLKQDQLVF